MTLAWPGARLEPAWETLGPDFADAVEPAAFPQAIPRLWNARAAASVGLDGLSEPDRAEAFVRFAPVEGGQAGPLAIRYHGHQFRSYNPQIGDGRGFLYQQLRETGGAGRLLDLATKGSGRTPWSRNGDGRLTLKGGVREVLAAALLEALGVPTSRAFALYETGEALSRGDEPSPTRSAVLTRLSWSHLRFGVFQRHAFFEQTENLARLVDYAGDHLLPELSGLPGDAKAAGLLAAAVARSAHLAARWMAAGFVHGVLNTDNMVVTGESFDYGPWRFLPRSDPGFTAAYFDETGLYAFGRQPGAVFWNLQQLAGTLAPLADQDALVEALNGFAPAYRAALSRAVALRLGVVPQGEARDADLAQAAFTLLAEGGEALRWEPLFFDWFGGAASERRALEGPRGAVYAGDEALAFRRALEGYAPADPARLGHPVFARPDPEELLIEELEALWAPIAARDDWAPFRAKLARIDQAREAYGLDGTAAWQGAFSG